MRLIHAAAMLALTCGGLSLMAGQQQTTGTDTPQTKQDVPQQRPGSNNPDVGTQHKAAPKNTPGQQPAAKGEQDNSDVPHQKPGTDNPDLSRRNPATPGTGTGTGGSTSSGTQKTRHSHSNKRRGTSTSTGSQTSGSTGGSQTL